MKLSVLLLAVSATAVALTGVDFRRQMFFKSDAPPGNILAFASTGPCSVQNVHDAGVGPDAASGSTYARTVTYAASPTLPQKYNLVLDFGNGGISSTLTICGLTALSIEHDDTREQLPTVTDWVMS
jgi:hypothetical protein